MQNGADAVAEMVRDAASDALLVSEAAGLAAAALMAEEARLAALQFRLALLGAGILPPGKTVAEELAEIGAAGTESARRIVDVHKRMAHVKAAVAASPAAGLQ